MTRESEAILTNQEILTLIKEASSFYEQYLTYIGEITFPIVEEEFIGPQRSWESPLTIVIDRSHRHAIME